MVAVVVTYPPGGKSTAHHHARSAFIYAYVLSGAIRSQVDDEPAKVYQVGEGFYEMPGSYHRISENASDRDPASLLAVFVVDSKDNPRPCRTRSRDRRSIRSLLRADHSEGFFEDAELPCWASSTSNGQGIDIVRLLPPKTASMQRRMRMRLSRSGL